ncbi:desulfoferrodoxin family protein [Catenisphaera adipataccumulans]|jgi:superoxide reductase|uniref:Superoxide reductase n=1 Tax=Catenisphaera adipataccumulans TaxID=700500 RepID=A0A7W8FY39_9FIRM|nr:desulfoferrodoxin family protein [Catenisphaera adipataccumulans]MBB5183622.1 superoxide reductase [Catenisphaera adipataccumulans]
MRLFKCDECGNVYEMVEQTCGCTPVCCGKPTRELKAGEVDAAQEKHVPAVSQTGKTLNVTVGSVEHPMTPEHHITAIWVEFEDGTSMKAGLTPAQKPTASFDVSGKSGKATVYEYCNLHGLWKAEFTIE